MRVLALAPVLAVSWPVSWPVSWSWPRVLVLARDLALVRAPLAAGFIGHGADHDTGGGASRQTRAPPATRATVRTG